MTYLNPKQRSAIRAIHDGRGPQHLHPATVAALSRRHLIHVTSDGEQPVVTLTATGERAYEQIMASGDGPEDLKERLRFRRSRR